MPKKIKKYTDQLNFLAEPGTIKKLVAMSYFLGTRGKYGAIAKRLVVDGIRTFESGLSPSNKKIYDEILSNLNITESDAFRDE